MMQMGKQANSKSGFHSFLTVDGTPFGSFEIFWNGALATATTNQFGEEELFEPGWYWWACFPGCLPESDAIGPFESSEEAYKNATEGD